MSTSKADDALLRVPRRRYFGQAHNAMLGSIQNQAQYQNGMLDRAGWTGRRVLGFKLPDWQRQAVWAEAQAQRFIESIYCGVTLGSYMVNLTLNNPDADLVLLDGQQRLRAIERYLAGNLAIAGETGKLHVWTELTSDEQARFYRMPFPWYESAFTNDADLREAYNRHNFGGTPHEEDERA